MKLRIGQKVWNSAKIIMIIIILILLLLLLLLLLLIIIIIIIIIIIRSAREASRTVNGKVKGYTTVPLSPSQSPLDSPHSPIFFFCLMPYFSPYAPLWSLLPGEKKKSKSVRQLIPHCTITLGFQPDQI